MNDNNENPKNQNPNINLSEQGNLSEHGNLSNQDTNFNTPNKSPWGEIFLGLGLSLLLIILMVASIFIGKAGIISIILLVLVFCSTFLSVKLIRQKRPIAGKILLSTVIPLTLLLLLFGACVVSLNGFN